jgi:hypothetical protein
MRHPCFRERGICRYGIYPVKGIEVKAAGVLEFLIDTITILIDVICAEGKEAG